MFLLTLHFCNTKYFFNQKYLLNWDAAHYEYIAHKDYVGFRNTFFPLFPFTWRYLSLNAIGIVIFNGLLFIFSLSFLSYLLQINYKSYLLMLTFPSLIFLFLPYSESLFFVASVLVLIGINKDYNSLIVIGMFMATLARPVGCLFIPVSLIFLLKDVNIFQAKKKIIWYILPILIGILVVVLIQYACTGDWFAFFHAEAAWGLGGNEFRLPKFHLISWGGDNIVKLDAVAFLIGLTSTISVICVVFANKRENELEKSNIFVFSLLYLSVICWFVLFTRGGSLFSLNRFVFATPFFFVAFSELIKKQWTAKQYIIIFLLLNVFWLMFGSYVHIQETLKYLALSFFLLLFLFIGHSNKSISRIAYFICLFGNIFLQIYFYNKFLSGGWVG